MFEIKFLICQHISEIGRGLSTGSDAKSSGRLQTNRLRQDIQEKYGRRTAKAIRQEARRETRVFNLDQRR
jgi:hypothetical protein